MEILEPLQLETVYREEELSPDQWPHIDPIHLCVIRNVDPRATRRVIEEWIHVSNKPLGTDFWGRTPLHILAEAGYDASVPMAKVLLTYYSPTLRDKEGRNVFHYIGKYKCNPQLLLETMKHLKVETSDLNINSNSGSPLGLALSDSDNNSLPLVLQFIRFGAFIPDLAMFMEENGINDDVRQVVYSSLALKSICYARKRSYVPRDSISTLPVDLLRTLKAYLF